MLRVLIPILALLALAGCGGGDDDSTPPRAQTSAEEAVSRPAGAPARAPASPTAGTLSQVALGPEAEHRLAYANLDALASADVPVARAKVLRSVLGAGSAHLGGRHGTVVRVGARGPVERPAQTAPQTSAITPPAQSAAQSCLGDTLAQTIAGPAEMGRDAALGVGLAESGDAPAGIQLRICGAPRLIRDLHAMERALDARFGDLGARAVVQEREIGEREIVTATVAAGALPPGDVLELLRGARALRALAWR